MCRFCDPPDIEHTATKNILKFHTNARIVFRKPNEIEVLIDDYDKISSAKINYCPMCGRKLMEGK